MTTNDHHHTKLPAGPVEVGGQLMMPGPPDRVGFRSVAVADAPELMDTFRAACRLARDAEILVADAGLSDDLLGVSALVDDTGRPAIQLLLTVAGARRLAEILTAGAGAAAPRERRVNTGATRASAWWPRVCGGRPRDVRAAGFRSPSGFTVALSC